MPLLNIHTNCAIPAESQSAILAGASALVADLLGKPEAYVMVSLRPDTPMCFASSTAPAACLELFSLGLPEDRTKDLSSRLCEFVTAELKVPANRTYIRFENPPRHMWGWNRGTFD